MTISHFPKNESTSRFPFYPFYPFYLCFRLLYYSRMTPHNTILLANGQFPQAPLPLNLLRNAERIVCCDGAAAKLLDAGMKPDFVVGDLDSLPASVRTQLSCPLIHIRDQETNDLNKAFRFCMENHWDDITILGATGEREDHTLGNLSLLPAFTEQCPSVQIVTDTGYFFALLHSGSLQCPVGTAISIFAFDTETPITSRGLQYPLVNFIPKRWWQATLNVATEDTVSLSFPDGHPILVFRTFS